MAENKQKKFRIPAKYRGVVLFLRDAGIAFMFVCLVLLTMFAYTGLWPPLVVVESNSMMHGTENLSHIGAIDTGDLVLVRDVDDATDVVTYLEGYVSGHKTYGEFGDVIVYRKSGDTIGTPIIHRAMLYLELNANGTSYRCAALKNVPEIKWSTSNTLDTWDNLTNLVIIHDVGWNDIEITVDIRTMLMSQRSGFVTKGDHNSAVDPLATDHGPVDISWVVGKARGEIPWFGLLKLWTTDTLGSTAPSNSVRNLWITVAFIIVTPVIVDIFLTYREKRLVEEKRARSAQKSGKIAKIDKRVEAEGPKKPPE